MRRPRLTTRRLMALVAVAAVALGAESTRRRWEGLSSTYRHRGFEFWLRAQLAEWKASVRVRRYGPSDLAYPEIADVISRGRRRSGYFLALSRKYEQAAARPWLPIPPDPPEPR